ncbi:MAG: tetratricopeptide repeat protein, partial [Chitinophagales bacterium]
YKNEIIGWIREFFHNLTNNTDKTTKTTKTSKKTKKKLKVVIAEEQRIIELNRKQATYYNLSKLILTSLRTKVSDKKKKELRELEELVAHPLLKSKEEAITFMSKTYYHDTLGLYYWKTGNLQEAYQHYEKLVELWEDNPTAKSQDDMLYRQSLGNYLNVCHSLGQDKMSMFPFILKKIKSLPKGNLDTQLKTFQLTVHHELLYYLNTGKFEEGAKVIGLIETELRTLEQQLPTSELFSIYYNISIIYFFSEDFSNTLLWLNEILSHPRTDVRKDIQQFAKILQFIIHYELDNEEILENLYRSVYRSIKKEEQLHEFEEMVLNYIRQLLVINPFDKKALNDCYNEFGEAISAMQARPDYVRILGAQETILWVVSKLQNTSVGDIFRKTIGVK